jgi:hypothetical protein
MTWEQVPPEQRTEVVRVIRGWATRTRVAKEQRPEEADSYDAAADYLERQRHE